jgi:recombination protein RecR
MNSTPQIIKNLIQNFSSLPGIGPKTAEKLVFSLIKNQKIDLHSFGQNLSNLKQVVKFCEQCGQLSEKNICPICSDNKRISDQICVVAESSEIAGLEKTNKFTGTYHVLNGLLDPLENMTPDKLNIDNLLTRIKTNQNLQEIILAINPTIQGETTCLYLTKIIKQTKPDLRVTKLARGLPQGSDLEYADEITLANAFSGRVDA